MEARRFDGLDDRDFHALGEAERLVIWAVRYWVTCFRASKLAGPGLGCALRGAGVGHAEDGLDFALTIVSQCALRPVDIRCSACRFVSPDEERLVEAVARLQANDGGGAWLAIADLLPAAAARIMLEALEGVAQSFSFAQLRIQPRANQLLSREPQDGAEPTDAIGSGFTVH